MTYEQFISNLPKVDSEEFIAYKQTVYPQLSIYDVASFNVYEFINRFHQAVIAHNGMWIHVEQHYEKNDFAMYKATLKIEQYDEKSVVIKILPYVYGEVNLIIQLQKNGGNQNSEAIINYPLAVANHQLDSTLLPSILKYATDFITNQSNL